MTRVSGCGTARASMVLLFVGTLMACPPAPGTTMTDPMTTGPTTGTSSSPTTMVTSSGAVTTTAGPEPMRCASLCEGDRDCLLGGQDLGFRCVAGLCVFPACTSDALCVAELSGWQTACTDQAGCAAMEVCVEVEGEGRCALEPGVFACADFGLVELMRPTIEGDVMATVCGQAEASCEAGECVAPCSDDASCPAPMGHPFCNAMSGQCECQVDQDCVDSQLAGFVLCIDGRCGCGSDADCGGGKNVDMCSGGVCGCSSDAACTEMVFDGAPLSCQ